MKKGFLSVLLTLFMMLMMLPTTAYAGKAYCETCGKWVGTTSTYEYKDGGYHWEHVSCAECSTNISNPRSKHNWSGTATCTSGQTCTVCGGTSNPNPLGHAYESTVTIEPTCTTDGVRTYVCKNDSSHTYTEPIPATEHNYESSVTTEPTCTTDGVRTYVCKNDSSHTYTEPIPAAGHNLEKAEKKEAGCTEAGYEAYWRCQACKKLFSDEAGTAEIINPKEIKATGHDLKAVKKKEASCTEDGYEAYWKCQTCKKLFSDEKGTKEINNPIEIKATGHNLEKIAQKEAGCTEA